MKVVIETRREDGWGAVNQAKILHHHIQKFLDGYPQFREIKSEVRVLHDKS